ncbi:hypothetical protein TNCV_1476291, partial [Trichonephila clavipes]
FEEDIRLVVIQEERSTYENDHIPVNPDIYVVRDDPEGIPYNAKRYSVFAEEAIQFTVNGRNILTERKRKKMGKRESPKLHDERCQSLLPE